MGASAAQNDGLIASATAIAATITTAAVIALNPAIPPAAVGVVA